MSQPNAQVVTYPRQTFGTAQARKLLSLILPFCPNIMLLGCDWHLTQWVAARTGWVVGVDANRWKVMECESLDLLNAEFFCGTLAEYTESDLAWDWRMGFDLVIADGVMRCADPAAMLKEIRAWAPWVLVVEREGMNNLAVFKSLFTKIIHCETNEAGGLILLGGMRL